MNEINFEKIKNENKGVIIYYKSNINEGLIGIIAARLKDYFNKPTIVLTKSNGILKASARSTGTYNIGHLIKLLINKKIIEKGGGHNMAAGFTLKKNNIDLLDDFIQKDYSSKVPKNMSIFNYDSELASSIININFINEVNKLGPFGNYNHLPIFLIKDVKVIKSNKLNDIHISSIIKPNRGSSIRSICFNSVNTEIGDYLLSYKKQINIIAQITENIWNNKKNYSIKYKRFNSSN